MPGPTDLTYFCRTISAVCFACSRLHLPSALLALAVQFLHVQWAIDQQPEAQRPNVLLFLLDDQGIARTPNGDKLAPSGIRFSDLYAGNPNSSLPRAALLTGLTAAGTTSVDIEQLPALPTGHRGYKLVKSAEVPLEFPPVVDGDEPALSTATVNGDSLRLTYEEALDGSSTPLADDFRVVVSGERKSVSAVMVGGSTVRLRLASAVAPGEAVTLSYTVGVGARAKPIRDEAGNEAAGFTNRAVVNRTGDKRVRTGKALPVKAVRQIEALLAAKEKRTPARRKVGSQLLDALRRARGQPAADRLVTVDIRADVTPAVLARIRSLGGTVVNSVPKYRAIRARLPLVSVEKLAALDAVQSIRTADKAVIARPDAQASPRPFDRRSRGGFPASGQHHPGGRRPSGQPGAPNARRRRRRHRGALEWGRLACRAVGLGEFGEWTPIADSAPDEVNALGYTVGELGNGTVYVFELRAVNLVGKGRESEAVDPDEGDEIRGYGIAGGADGGLFAVVVETSAFQERADGDELLGGAQDAGFPVRGRGDRDR